MAAIETYGLSKSFRADEGSRRGDLQRFRRRDVRYHRAGRGRQDHSFQAADHTAGARQRLGTRTRIRYGSGLPHDTQPYRLHAGALLALSRPVGQRESRIFRGPVRRQSQGKLRPYSTDIPPDRTLRQTPRRQVVGRHEAEARPLLRTRPPAVGALPRRTDHRRRCCFTQ